MASSNLSEYNLESNKKFKEFKIGVVVSEWNKEITDGLLKGVSQVMEQFQVAKENIIIKHVPGSFELPLGAQFLLEYNNLDAVICLGCVIQGETRHFDFVCDAVSQGVKDVSLKYNKPVIFGVLTDNNIEQSRARSGGKLGNKGIEVAVSAIKMIALQKSLN